LSKDVTFHINNEAYTINLGDDHDGFLEECIKKFLSTDEPLTTKEVLLAYLRRTQEFVNFQREIENEINSLPTIEKLKPNLEKLKTE
jgi:hypothetical protein